VNETALVHPLVAGYLILFDAEASVLPVPRGGRCLGLMAQEAP